MKKAIICKLIEKHTGRVVETMYVDPKTGHSLGNTVPHPYRIHEIGPSLRLDNPLKWATMIDGWERGDFVLSVEKNTNGL